MPSWKKVIVSGSNAVLNQITASGNFVSDGTVIITGNTGRVGINTLAPDYKLDVAGNAGFNEYLYHNGDSNTYLRFQSDKIDLSAIAKGYVVDQVAKILQSLGSKRYIIEIGGLISFDWLIKKKSQSKKTVRVFEISISRNDIADPK
mgnify:CR=1 FL=1